MLKRKIKKIIAIALTATMMISASSMPAMVNAATIESSSAVSEVYGDFYYGYDGKGITIMGYRGDQSDVVIPDEINGYPVISIRYDCFRELENLRSLKLPANLIEIQWRAVFRCNNLTEIIIPNKVVKIGFDAFLNCPNLKRVTIPKSVIEIGEYAFGYTYRVFQREPWLDYTEYEYNKVEGFTIYTPPKSSAVEYANQYDVTCVEIPIGDVDLDGEVTIQDATLMQRYCADNVTIDNIQLSFSDADSNGDININDATAIQKIVAAN